MNPRMPVTLATFVDRTSVRPDEPTTLAVAIALGARRSADAPTDRKPLRTVLALDVSGSMGGQPLAHVIKSVDRLLDALGDEDELGVAVFSDQARRIVEPVRMDASGKRLVRARVGRLAVENQTNIEAGLNTAAAMLDGRADRRSVILLSDGAPNVGAHTAEALREVIRKHRPAVSFFALGYGINHAEQILAAVGEAGGAGYEYVPDPATCARAFARALGAQSDVVATGLELVIAPAEGVELVRFLGKEDTRFGRQGITITLPDMVNGAERVVAFELRVRAPRDKFLCALFDVCLRGTAEGAALDARADAAIEIADRVPAMIGASLRQILLVRADEARDAARALADRGQFPAAALAIRAVMSDIERIPGWIACDGSPLAEAHELLLDEAMAFEKRPSPEAYAAFRKGTVASKLASAVPLSAYSRGPASQRLVDHMAGDLPEAWLVVGNERHPLGEQCVIGRTNGAHIRVMSNSVSRRHAEIFASAGEFWIADLGSTNPTIVNGRNLAGPPHKLVPGDVVTVGEVSMRYEQA